MNKQIRLPVQKNYCSTCVFFIQFPCFLRCIMFYFSFIWLHVDAFAINSMVHCWIAFEPGASELTYYCTPPVTILDVIDWSWKSGWLIHKWALCTRIAPLLSEVPKWFKGPTKVSTSRRSQLVRKIGSQNQSMGAWAVWRQNPKKKINQDKATHIGPLQPLASAEFHVTGPLQPLAFKERSPLPLYFTWLTWVLVLKHETALSVRV